MTPPERDYEPDNDDYPDSDGRELELRDLFDDLSAVDSNWSTNRRGRPSRRLRELRRDS
jgi:hypothetical protein